MTTTPHQEDDGIPRIPANENPWYILMTLHGEYEDGISNERLNDLIPDNSSYFTHWQDHTSPYYTQAINLFNSECTKRTGKILELPSPETPIIFTNLEFIKPLYIGRIQANADIFFKNCTFIENIEFLQPVLQNLSFQNCSFSKYFNINYGSSQNVTFIDCTLECGLTINQGHFKEIHIKNCRLQSLQLLSTFIASALYLTQKTSVKKSIIIQNTSGEGNIIFDDTLVDILQIHNNTKLLSLVDIKNSSFREISFKESAFKIIKFSVNNTCSGDLNFTKIKSEELDFSGARIEGSATFTDCEFSDSSNFISTIFKKNVHFNTKFKNANFKKSEFHGIADFSGTTFTTSARFHSAAFHEMAKFPSSLNENVSFYGANFSNVIANYKNENDAYEGLLYFQIFKKYMENNKRHHDEMLFFKYEMQTLEYLNSLEKHGWIKNIPSKLYGFFSDYGASIASPLAGLYIVFFLGAWDFKFLDDLDIATSIKLSIANTFSPFGLHKILFQHPPELTLIASNVVMSLQFIFGTVFLFLLGLGLRNRFKIK